MVKYGKRTWGQRASSMVAKAAPYVARGVRAYVKARRRSTSTGRMSTFQKDQVQMYRKKRMPKKKRKRWVRLIKQHNALEQNGLGLHTLIITDNNTITSLVGSQDVIELGAMTNNGPVLAPRHNRLNHLSQLSDNETAQATQKFNMVSYRQDITIANSGTSVCEIDIYTIVPIKKGINSTTEDTAIEFWQKGYANANAMNLDPKPTIFDLGASPFSSRYFSQHFKIVKVKRVYLGTGNCTSWTISKPGNRQIKMETLQNNATAYIPGMSSCQLIIFRGCPTAASAAGAATLSWNVQTTLNYKLEGDTENRIGWN